ncbi:MAG: hypothetical protein IKP64_06760 [Selenomonadaceae bacterium]|nr:hypothetical protein [Selenomonadaceae bacterium]
MQAKQLQNFAPEALSGNVFAKKSRSMSTGINFSLSGNVFAKKKSRLFVTGNFLS